MGAVIRDVSATVGNDQVVFFRNLIGMLFFVPWLFRNGLRVVHTRVLHLHLLRALSGLTAMYCFFYLIANIRLADAMLFNYSAPVFIPVIAWLWLKEPITRRRYASVVVGLVGVLLVLKPGTSVFDVTGLLGLAAATFAAIAFVSVQRLSRSESSFVIVFYFSSISTVISAVPLLWGFQPLGGVALTKLIAVGALATISQLCMTKAYGLAPAAQIGPVAYASIVFAGVFGWLLWGEVPDVWSFAGAALIFSAALMTVQLVPRRVD